MTYTPEYKVGSAAEANAAGGTDEFIDTNASGGIDDDIETNAVGGIDNTIKMNAASGTGEFIDTNAAGGTDDDVETNAVDEIDDFDSTEADSAGGDRFSFVIDPGRAGERLDKVISDCLPGQSRSYIKKLIKEGNIRIEKEGIPKSAKPAAAVSGGETVSVFLPVQMLPDILPEDIPLDILYEDNDILVVNKPKGMVVHPAAGHYSGTLVNAVLFHCKGSLSGINGVLRPGIVHRIDKDTTGSIIVCKNDAAHQSIAQQLAEHSIVRRYRAIVLGNIREDELTISQPIGRDPSDRKKMAVRPDGRRAVTHVRVLERFGNYTYVECRLETGRTHQIRVHMAFSRHPLLGDTVYGSRRKSSFTTCGQCLHAQILGFIHPVSGKYIETEAPLPEYFEKILRTLRAENS